MRFCSFTRAVKPPEIVAIKDARRSHCCRQRSRNQEMYAVLPHQLTTEFKEDKPPAHYGPARAGQSAAENTRGKKAASISELP